MQSVSIEIRDNKVIVKSPYNKEFVDVARQLGGKFINSSDPGWMFDTFLEGRIREKLLEIYGTDGSATPTTTILLDLDALNPKGSELVIGIIHVLKKWGRDTYPKLGEGCAVIAGALKRIGGSVNYPELTWEDGTIIRITGIPVRLATKLIAAGYATEEADKNKNTTQEVLETWSDSYAQEILISLMGLENGNSLPGTWQLELISDALKLAYEKGYQDAIEGVEG